ncbi:MAG: TolC family protein [Candidatus Schekmanbacteria bacterium]|nr:TolC family protein [Candidatus Schekmanbacteria bacterium]
MSGLARSSLSVRRLLSVALTKAITIVLAGLSSLPPALAEPVTVSALPDAGGVELPLKDGAVELALQTAYSLSLSRNLDLRVQRYDVAIADDSAAAAFGIFDPAFSLVNRQSRSDSATSTSLAGASVLETKTQDYSLGVTQLLPIGTALSVGATMTRTENNSFFYSVNPSYAAGLSASLVQPLLKGFGTAPTRAGIIVAKNTRQQSSAAFALKVVSTLQLLEHTYWDLIAAREAMQVKEQSRDLARKLRDQTAERIRVGAAAKIDIVQSEAGVAVREQELIAARNVAASREDELKRILGFASPEEWAATIRISETLETTEVHPELNAAIATAMNQRPEIHQQLLAVETLKLSAKVSRNARLPKLDLDAQYGWGGLGGDVKVYDSETGEVIDVLPGGVNDAWRQIRDRDFPHWSVGLTLSVPILNRQARAGARQKQHELERGMAQMDALRQLITTEVRAAVRALEDGAALLQAAKASLHLAERNLEAEQVKFANGLSTSFQVLEIQKALAEAQLNELTARVAYRRSLVAYRVAAGTMLEEAAVKIIDPAAPDLPWNVGGAGH